MQLIPPENLIQEYAGAINAETYATSGHDILFGTVVPGANLARSAQVLDIGCGCGRLARHSPITSMIEGDTMRIDVGKSAIDWCREAYKDFPNFQFHHAELHSKRYQDNESFQQQKHFLLCHSQQRLSILYILVRCLPTCCQMAWNAT